MSNIIPEEFCKIMKDFIKDIKQSFPEYNFLINKWWKDEEQFSYINEEEERKIAIAKSEKTSLNILFSFCKKKYPQRFFDILYQNDTIFKEDSEIDTEFLPHIYFKTIWQLELTDKTRETIWKYLQLILFSIINTIQDKDAFGDTSKLFEAINEDEFKSKLEETMNQMQDIFNLKENDSGTGCSTSDNSNNSNNSNNINFNNLPDVDELRGHISGLLDGKLGKLAKEIAEETAENLNMDMDNVTDMKDVFNNLIKNPTKLMGLVKNVGDKLDNKIKSGEINETELLEEVTEMMNKMKNMPGIDGIKSMLSKFGMTGMTGLGKGAKLNYSAIEASLNKKLKNAKTKERIRSKIEMNKLMKETHVNLEQLQKDISSIKEQPILSEEELIALCGNEQNNVKSQPIKNKNKNKNKK